MTRFYVTMTWDNWPEGGSYCFVGEAESHHDAERFCRDEMAASRADECMEEDGHDADWFLETYGDEWHTVDCYDLDEHIARHSTAAPYVALRYTIDRLERIKAYGDAMDSEDGDGPQPPNGDDYNEIFGWAMAALSHARSAPAKRPEVTVFVQGGIVQGYECAAMPVDVTVHDYDVECGTDGRETGRDKVGDEFIVTRL